MVDRVSWCGKGSGFPRRISRPDPSDAMGIGIHLPNFLRTTLAFVQPLPTRHIEEVTESIVHLEDKERR